MINIRLMEATAGVAVCDFIALALFMTLQHWRHSRKPGLTLAQKQEQEAALARIMAQANAVVAAAEKRPMLLSDGEMARLLAWSMHPDVSLALGEREPDDDGQEVCK